MDSIKKILTTEELQDFNPQPALLKRGECSFHHPLTVHGSFQNKTNKPRRAAVINLFADGTLSDSD